MNTPKIINHESYPNPSPGIKETQVFHFPNAVVRVHFPDIDDEENERRLKLVKKAAEDFLRAVLQREQLVSRLESVILKAEKIYGPDNYEAKLTQD